MEQLLAVINFTYKESVRKRVFWVIILFAGILVSSSLLLPVVNPADRVKLIEVWSLRSISLFGMLMAIFLAAISIPEDIEDHKFHIVFTKPLSRGTFIIGKLMGYISVMAVFVAVMGLLSLGYLNIINAFISPAPNALSSLARLREKIKATDFSFTQPASNKGGIVSGDYSAGEEKPVEVRLTGEIGNCTTWRFEGLNPAELTDPFQAEVKVGITEKGFRLASIVIVGAKIYDPKNKQVAFLPIHKVEIRHYGTSVLEFNRQLIDHYGDLELFIQRTNPSSELTVTPSSVQILSAPKSFTWNYLKTLGLIFFQIILITILVLMGSTFLSSGITMIFGIFLLFCGAGMSFFKESLKAMGRAIHYAAPLEAVQKMAQHGHEDTFPLWMMKSSQFILNYAFKILPDFSIFRGSDYLQQGVVIPSAAILDALGYLGFLGLVGVIIGWLCFRIREFK